MEHSLKYAFIRSSGVPNSFSLFPFHQALGNHEFDNGVEGLIDPLLKKANFPILSANIKAKGPLASQISGLYLPYKILSVGAELVGIVGYTSKETPFLSNPGIFYFYSIRYLKIDALNQNLALSLWTVGKRRNNVWCWTDGKLRMTLMKPNWWLPCCSKLLLKDILLLLNELLC